MSDDQKSIKNTMSGKHTRGPHGLGEPDDKTLRKVEIEVMIPKKMREIAKNEHCAQYVAEFSKCCKESSILMPITCRKETTALTDCLDHWYADEQFKERCKNEYLEERSEFRRTGIMKKKKRMT